MSTPEEAHIKREVNRQVAAQLRQNGEYVKELQSNVQELQSRLVRQNDIINRLTGDALTFGRLLRTHNYVNPAKYKLNDEVIVIDPSSPYYQRAGRIINNNENTPIVDPDGCVYVMLGDDTQERFAIGVEGKAPAQIRLTQKDDGTFAIINLDGKPWEVRGVPDLSLCVGDPVKVRPDNKAIVSKGCDLNAGPICNVVSVNGDRVEVMHKGDNYLIYNPRKIDLREGDRIACDPSMFCVMDKLPEDNRERYKLTTDLNLTWEEVGGLDLAKQELRDALELPFQQPELFKYYSVESLRGVLLYGAPGCGKAQPLWSKIFTPSGPISMGEIKLGDHVCTPDGSTAPVIGLFPQGEKPIYCVTFSDGSKAHCCEDHLWQVETRNNYCAGVFDTKTLMKKLKMNDGKRIYSIPMTKPVRFLEKPHIIHPYVMGVLLAEGHFGSSVSVTICEDELLERFSSRIPDGYIVKGSISHKSRPCDLDIVREDRSHKAVLTDEIRRLGLSGKLSQQKFIPAEYLYDSVDNRYEILKGLMDGDGYVSKSGYGVYYCTTSSELAVNVQFLVQSLGGKCVITQKETTYIYKAEKRSGRTAYVCTISLLNMKELFSLKRKRERVKERSTYAPKRLIESIEYFGMHESQCILVDHPDHLYLTNEFVVTHNTMLARVAAWAMAQLHGKSSVESGYIYVKAPEILDKWVGNTEKEIRNLFERGRRHFREHGYKAILAFDEADAIMPQRGTRRSSDISDTIVPMFLGEMDGVDPKQTQENPIVFLLTNRADVLDPAVTRPGRISRHIKIDRPSLEGSIDILKIHTKVMPFENEKNKEAILTLAATDLFSKTRLLYRINNEHDFTLGDCVNGAMLANIAEITKMNALHRDLTNRTQTGVSPDDFKQAVKKVFHQQRGVNHSYDIQDFCEKIGIQSQSAKIERVFGAA